MRKIFLLVFAISWKR